MRIALVAVLALAALWFVALKPKPDSGTPAPAPAGQQQNGTGLVDRPNEAQSAVNSANAKNSANEKKADQTGEPTQTTQTTQSAVPQSKAAPKTESKSAPKIAPATKKSTDPSAPIIASAKSGNVEVVLFWDPSGSDDRHVHQAVQQVNTRGGTVKIHTIAIDDVGKYTALTQDVAVNVAPTLMIISPKLKAWKITGYTDTAEINGLVGAIARQSEN
jgi:hypothetical protein